MVYGTAKDFAGRRRSDVVTCTAKVMDGMIERMGEIRESSVMKENKQAAMEKRFGQKREEMGPGTCGIRILDCALS